jgi:hypothetical protein
LRVENLKPKLILLDPKARDNVHIHNLKVWTKAANPKGIRQADRAREDRALLQAKTKTDYRKQKQDKNYTKRKSQPKLQGNKQQRSTPSE